MIEREERERERERERSREDSLLSSYKLLSRNICLFQRMDGSREVATPMGLGEEWNDRTTEIGSGSADEEDKTHKKIQLKNYKNLVII